MLEFRTEIRRLAWHIAVLKAETSLLALARKAGFRPDQPRVPAGNSGGGRWAGGLTLVQQRTPRGSAPRRIMGTWLDATPNQITRLEISHFEMWRAIAAVRRIEPRWKPEPQAYESIEGQIRASNAVAADARFRLYQHVRPKIAPGTFAREWFPAPPTNRRLRVDEQSEVDRLGRLHGCHTCGSRDPLTRSGRFFGDHQMPKSLGTPLRIYPQCLQCSCTQGGFTRVHKGKKP